MIDELAEDLDGLGETKGMVDKERAVRLARAMHAFIFHEGPDPDEVQE